MSVVKNVFSVCGLRIIGSNVSSMFIIAYINKEEYNRKTLTFIHNNNFQSLNPDPTVKFHKTIKDNLKQCNLIINKNKLGFSHRINLKPPT